VPRHAHDLVLVAAAHPVRHDAGASARSRVVPPDASGLVLSRGGEQTVVPGATRHIEDAAVVRAPGRVRAPRAVRERRGKRHARAPD